MQAVVVTPGQAGSARVADVSEPEPQPGQAVMRVIEVGVCGTDSEIVQGLYGEAPPSDDYLILGHENFGQIVSAPEGAPVSAGDYAICRVRRPCPIPCKQCAAGENDMCSSGQYTERGIKGLHGFMAELVADTADTFVKVPAQCADVGVLMEPLTVVEKAVRHVELVQRRMTWEADRAVVTGAGPIGLLATMLLRAKGYEVFVLDLVAPDSLRAQVATACGAQYVHGEQTSLADLAQRLHGIDVLVEATAAPQLVFQAIDTVGPNGVVCLTGVGAHGRTLEIPADHLNLEMVLENKLVFGTVNANQVDYEAAAAGLGQFESLWPGLCARMITRSVAVEEFQSALATDKDVHVKTTIRFA